MQNFLWSSTCLQMFCHIFQALNGIQVFSEFLRIYFCNHNIQIILIRMRDREK